MRPAGPAGRTTRWTRRESARR
ncbi:hypothetical protein, partial [Streptomyces sp. CB02366]